MERFLLNNLDRFQAEVFVPLDQIHGKSFIKFDLRKRFLLESDQRFDIYMTRLYFWGWILDLLGFPHRGLYTVDSKFSPRRVRRLHHNSLALSSPVNSFVMPLKVVAPSKTLATQLALVGFLSRVCPHMLAKVLLWEKLFTTVVTPVMRTLRNTLQGEDYQPNTCEV